MRSRGRESQRGSRPERAGRGWYVKRCAASVRLPGRRARLAASDRHWWTDAEPLSCVAQPGKRIVAVEPPGARRARVVRCIRPIARAASRASGCSQWTDAKTFREPRGRESEGYVRRCFTSPAHPSSCPCGRNPWRRARFALQAVIGGRTRSLCCASRSRGKESSQWNCPERVQSPVRAESVAASAACGFRPSLMDGRGAFSVRRAAGKEDHRSGTARNAPGEGST